MTDTHRNASARPAFFDTLLVDVRHAVRKIINSPGFSAIAILSIGLGIAANTAMFSVINAVLLRPLAYADPDRLFVVNELTSDSRGRGVNLVNPMHAESWASECPSLEQLGLLAAGRVQVSSGSEPTSVAAARVSDNLFTLLGVHPLHGRSFLKTESELGHDGVVMLSESLWRSRFNANPSLVGQTISIDRTPHVVVGILPASFRSPAGSEAEVFMPLVIRPQERLRLAGNHNYFALVRLRPGISAAQATAEIDTVQSRFPRQAGAREPLQARLTPLHQVITESARSGLWLLAAAVGAVLLIACVNLANLLLSRMASRGREAAIRTALGASRARQLGQVMVENLILAIGGGLIAVVLARWIVQILVATATIGIPRLHEVRVDTPVLLFALVLTLVVGLVSGALPAWRFTRRDAQPLLSGGRGTSEAPAGVRMRETLIAVEVAMSAALLIVAGLLTSSLTRLLNVDKGFDTSQVLTVDIDPAGGPYEDAANRQRFFETVLTDISANPTVQVAGLTTHLPTRGQTWMDPIYLEGAAEHDRRVVNNRYTSPGYFKALNVAVREGRLFTESDRAQRVAVLSVKAATQLWPDTPNPVGRTFVAEDNKPVTLIGIVADVRASLQSEPPPTAYYPYWQRVPDEGVTLVIRTSGNPAALTGAVRAALRRADPQLPIRTIQTMDDLVGNSVATRRFQLTLMAFFAISATFVASLGIYGVVSFAVTRRRKEMGIRMALGARRGEVLRLIIRQGMLPVVVGLTTGIALALVAARAIRGLLFNIQPADPLTIVAVCAVLLSIGTLACLIPARKISNSDALMALRME
jgi:predicted permease